MVRILIVFLFGILVSACATHNHDERGAMGYPDWTKSARRPFDQSLQSFSDRLWSAARAGDSASLAALAHPAIEDCESWSVEKRDIMVGVLDSVGGRVRRSDEKFLYVYKEAEFLHYAKSHGHVWPVTPSVELWWQRAGNTTVLRAVRYEGEWYYVWNCF